MGGSKAATLPAEPAALDGVCRSVQRSVAKLAGEPLFFPAWSLRRQTGGGYWSTNDESRKLIRHTVTPTVIYVIKHKACSLKINGIGDRWYICN
jgi:hypothetical protein